MPILRLLAIALVLLTALPVTALSAGAQENKPLNATYTLLAGGVRMVGIDAMFDIGPDYAVKVDGKTLGAFSKILPWTGTFETIGQTKGYNPVRHDYAVSWRGNVDTSTFLYDPPGKFKSMTQTKDGETKENPVDPSIAADTRDLLSTIMVMLDRYAATGKCEGDVLTFDNARSFITRFKDIGQNTMSNPKASIYTGPAHGCSVEIVPQKGKWPKKPRGWLRIQEQAKAGGRLPVLWLAKPRPDATPIPVRVDIHTKYGDVIAHLTKLTP